MFENKSTNWEKVKVELDESINLKVPLKNKMQLDIEAKNCVKIIQNTVKEHTINYVRNRILATQWRLERKWRKNVKQGGDGKKLVTPLTKLF